MLKINFLLVLLQKFDRVDGLVLLSRYSLRSISYSKIRVCVTSFTCAVHIAVAGSPPKESRRERERSADRDSYDDSLALPPPKISNFDPDDDMRKSPPERVPFHRGDRDEDMRLGSHRHKRDMGRETLPPPLFGSSSSGGAMSLFDLNVAPSAELQQKLDAGLYDELTAPLSESDDDRSGRYDSPLKRSVTF